jgi:biotin transport system substrate-specific component
VNQGIEMTTANSSRSLIESTMSADGAARIGMYVFLAVLGTIALAIASKITVPLFPVPATLQTLVLFTLAAAYGRNLAVATLLLYILEGALGAPVFAKGAGLGYLLSGPTSGYLAGFVIAAAITGYAADKGYDRNPFKLFGFMLIGEIVILALGATWLAGMFGAEKAFEWGVGPFIWTDLIKIALASAIVPAVWALFKRPSA